MYFKGAFIFSLFASALAAPIANGDQKVKRGILSVQDYSQFQISDGVAGNALAEVQAKFPVRIEHASRVPLTHDSPFARSTSQT
jgi:predicted N-acyltransferase